MALKLMICHGLYCGTKLMPIDIEALTFCASDNLCGIPGVYCELHEDHAFGIEEEEDLIQPVYDLSVFIRTRSVEIALFRSVKHGRIHQDANQSARCCDKCLFPVVAPGENADVRSMLEQFELKGHTHILIATETNW